MGVHKPKNSVRSRDRDCNPEHTAGSGGLAPSPIRTGDTLDLSTCGLLCILTPGIDSTSGCKPATALGPNLKGANPYPQPERGRHSTKTGTLRSSPPPPLMHRKLKRTPAWNKKLVERGQN